jgi:hypothetical protein
MQSGIIVGYDPGGNDSHGLAELHFRDDKVMSISTKTLRTVESVMERIESLSSLAALGVDTLTCWGMGISGWRPADRWLRNQYMPVQGSVMTPNSLFGSMGLNGMAVLIAVRARFPDILNTETHPKVLCWCLTSQKHDYPGVNRAMDTALGGRLGIPLTSATEHEWDAAVSAFAALEGYVGRWQRDLHTLPAEGGERLIRPCGDTQYFWPE